MPGLALSIEEKVNMVEGYLYELFFHMYLGFVNDLSEDFSMLENPLM